MMIRAINIKLVFVALFGFGGEVLAQPSINTVTGDIRNTLTIAGSGFTEKANAKPLFWWKADFGTTPSSLGRKTAWDLDDNLGTFSTAVVAVGSQQAVAWDHGATTGAALSPIFFESNRVYLHRKTYEDFDVTTDEAIRTRVTLISGTLNVGDAITGTTSGATGTVVAVIQTNPSITYMTHIVQYNNIDGTINNQPAKDFVSEEQMTSNTGAVMVNAESKGIFRTFNFKTIRFWGNIEGGVQNNMYTGAQGAHNSAYNITTEGTGPTTWSNNYTNQRLYQLPYEWKVEEVQYQTSGIGVTDGVWNFYQKGILGTDNKFRTRTTEHPNRYKRIAQSQVSHNAQPGSVMYYDAVYLDDTWHRVVISEGSTWATRGNVEIQIPAEWSDGEIVITTNLGGLNPTSALYLYVVDEHGVANENGYPLALGSPINVSSVSVTPQTKTLEVGQTQQLTASVLPTNATNKSITWSSNDETIATVSTTGLVTAIKEGTATITVTTQDGNKTATFVITVTAPSPTLTADAGQDKTITCTTAQATLGGSNTSNGVTYAWTTSNGNIVSGGTAKTATVNKAGTYTLTVSKSGSTTVTDDVEVTEDKTPPTANAGTDKTINSGESTQLNATGGATYSWSPSAGLSNSNIANPMATPTTTTTYTVTVTGSNGCTASDQVKVMVNDTADPCETSPIANAGVDVTIEKGSSTQLTATGGNIYSWSPTTGLSDANIANPEASPTTTMTYTVTVTDSNGCTATDEVTITIVEKEFKINNNSFSPNGDNINDVWNLEALKKYPTSEITIYNRWGNKVFTSSTGYPTPWNGIYKGKALPMGTYFYILKLGDGQVIKGNVNIIK